MILFSYHALALLSLILSTAIASGNYSLKVSKFLEKVKLLKGVELIEKKLNYSGHWFINLVRTEEKDVSEEEHRITIKQLPDLAKKGLKDFKTRGTTGIKKLIDEYYEKLLEGDKKYHYQVIRALDKFINDKLAAEMISDNWLKNNGKSIKEATKSLCSICGVSVNKKTADSAKVALEKLNRIPEKCQHENIWFYLTYCKISKEKFPMPVKLPLLAPVLSHQTNISELTDENIFTKMSLNILKDNNNGQALSKLLPLDTFITGTVPTFRLLTLNNAKEIIQSIPIKSIKHVHFVFIFGVNIDIDIDFGFEEYVGMVAHYELDRLNQLAGWIEELWEDKDISIEKKKSNLACQLLVPYLSLKKLFKNNKLDEGYAKKIANEDNTITKLIDFAIAQQNLENDEPMSCEISEMFSAGRLSIFRVGDYCDWNCAASKHFRELLSRFITFLAEFSTKRKEILKDYLGYDYVSHSEISDYGLSIDVLKIQYELYGKAYDIVTQQISEMLSHHSEGRRREANPENPQSKLESLSRGERIRLERKFMALDKIKICRNAITSNFFEQTLEYCQEDLQSILSAVLKFNFFDATKDSEIFRTLMDTGAPMNSLKTSNLEYKYLQLDMDDIDHVEEYVKIIFQIYCRPLSSTSIIKSDLDLFKLYSTIYDKLINCKTDSLWKPIYYYLSIVNTPNAVKIKDVNYHVVETLSHKVQNLVKKSKLPLVASAIVSSLDFKSLTQDQMQDIMRDALLDKLKFPVAFFWYLLKAHFEKNVFKWNVFSSELSQKLSLSTGMEILNEIKRIDLEKQNNHHREYKNYIKRYKFYEERIKNQKKETFPHLEEYKKCLDEFDEKLTIYAEYIRKLGDCKLETSNHFFYKFHQLLINQSSITTQSTVETPPQLLDDLNPKDCKSPPNEISNTSSDESPHQNPSVLLQHSMKSFEKLFNDLITKIQKLSKN